MLKRLNNVLSNYCAYFDQNSRDLIVRENVDRE